MNSQKLKIIGYYNHNNVGDQQYIKTFKILFENYSDITFIDCDKLKKDDIEKDDIIIFGGGDIISRYFIKKLLSVVDPTKNKIYAVSVGIPFISYIFEQDLSIFEHIFVRSRFDYYTLSKYYKNISYMPDISILLNKLNNEKCIEIPEISGKILGITAIQNCDFDKVIKIITDYYIKGEYFLLFIPFNTNANNLSENDNIMHEKIIKHLIEFSGLKNYQYENLKQTTDPLKIYNTIKILDIYITSRYHGCQFAQQNNIKFIPIYETQKIKNFINDIKYSKKNGLDFEIDIKTFGEIFKTKKTSTSSLNTYISDIYKKLTIGYDNLYDISDKNRKEVIVKACSYLLTGSFDSVYNYGLSEKMFLKDFNFESDIKWILNDILSKDENTFQNDTQLYRKYFNITYKNQNDNSGVHRSGWKYVYDNIIRYSSESDKKVLLDLYVDETFHWSSELYKMAGIIPYKKPWVGIIHHTFNNEFTKYNCNNLLKNELFIKSLEKCRCLIVLSKYLKKQLDTEFRKMGICIPIYVLYHPTETNVSKFDINSFENSNDKQILSIGSWYRNIYSFYNLNFKFSYSFRKYWFYCVTRISNFSKVILSGKNSSNYFPSDDFLHELKSIMASDIKTEPGDISMCCPDIKNNWYIELFKDLSNKIGSVNVVKFLTNEYYDDIITKNIVFCNLIDASAVNTLIECVARNTPIIINKHPAVIEILGPEYPLYLENLKICNGVITVPLETIRKTNIYLSHLDKTILEIDYFVKGLLGIMNN